MNCTYALLVITSSWACLMKPKPNWKKSTRSAGIYRRFCRPASHIIKKWDLIAIVARKLTEWNPEDPGNFVDWADAICRTESIHAAHAILTRAASLHPTDPAIQFNLACYEAQMGNLDRANAHLKRATEIDAKFRLMALKDPDLEPLRSLLAD